MDDWELKTPRHVNFNTLCVYHMGVNILSTISFYSVINIWLCGLFERHQEQLEQIKLSIWWKTGDKRTGDTVGGKGCEGGNITGGDSQDNQGPTKSFTSFGWWKGGKSFFGLGFLGSLQCHHPSIKCMTSILLYDGKPKIKTNENTLCILSNLFFYFCHVGAAVRAVLLFSQFVSLCALSSPLHTTTLLVSLTCSGCNLALLLKMCVRRTHVEFNVLGYK